MPPDAVGAQDAFWLRAKGEDFEMNALDLKSWAPSRCTEHELQSPRTFLRPRRLQGELSPQAFLLTGVGATGPAPWEPPRNSAPRSARVTFFCFAFLLRRRSPRNIKR